MCFVTAQDEFVSSFFFSSRRRHTRWPRDWSSDVCSSDLHFRHLREDTLVKKFMGGRCPHHSLLGKDLRYLAKFNVQMDIKEMMHDVIEPILPEHLILDFDSTVETLYGNQRSEEHTSELQSR